VLPERGVPPKEHPGREGGIAEAKNTQPSTPARQDTGSGETTMSDGQKERENEVFNQRLSVEDLDAVSGGTDNPWYYCLAPYALAPDMQRDDNTTNCANFHHRPLYGGNFPNCAATVEDGSWCGDNDACLKSAVLYRSSMVDPNCVKAWH
jgi:hypothetical protein